MTPEFDIAVAVIRRSDGRVLLADRPYGKAWAGYWEFPGGKVDTGETVAEALARELREELGIVPETVFPWITRVYDYPERRVRLHCMRVTAWRGEPQGREGQRLSWEDSAAPAVSPLLPANDVIMKSLCLPPVYAITNAAKVGETEFMARLDLALERGTRLIQVRESGFTAERFGAFARAVVGRARCFNARVLINGDASLARTIGADGVHLQSGQLMALESAPEMSLWAASCHDRAELGRAAMLGADFAVLSPVLPTPTHPEAAGIGWDRFAALTRDCPIPTYALGGMRLEMLDTAMQHGAHGIAMLSGVWPAPRG
jgi:8-oxo-dGTP diphosphatase